MIRTQMEMCSRSEMVAVLGMPYVILSHNSDSTSSTWYATRVRTCIFRKEIILKCREIFL
jgi:hypothetical protein